MIYYQSEGRYNSSVHVSGGEAESHSLDCLERGVTYYISIVALSDHLPSPLVGPVTPTSVTPGISLHLTLISIPLESNFTVSDRTNMISPSCVTDSTHSTMIFANNTPVISSALSICTTYTAIFHISSSSRETVTQSSGGIQIGETSPGTTASLSFVTESSTKFILSAYPTGDSLNILCTNKSFLVCRHRYSLL